MAGLLRRSGYLRGGNNYQDLILSALAEEDEREEQERMETLIESIFAIVNPEGYRRYKESQLPEEEGLDGLVHRGEDIDEGLRAFREAGLI